MNLVKLILVLSVAVVGFIALNSYIDNKNSDGFSYPLPQFTEEQMRQICIQEEI